MAQLVLKNIDAETVEKLEMRAKRLGTTPEEEAAQLLRDRLRAEPHREPATTTSVAAVKRKHGFLVFVGAVKTEEIPDHRVLRDERIVALLERADEGRV